MSEQWRVVINILGDIRTAEKRANLIKHDLELRYLYTGIEVHKVNPDAHSE